MNLDQKPWIFLWRPFYRSVVISIVWPFLHRLKEVFFRETVEELRGVIRRQAELSHRIIPLENQLNGLSHEVRRGFAETLSKLTNDHQRQWAALESALQIQFNERSTTTATQMNVLSQLIRQEFEVAVTKLIGEHHQQSTIGVEQITALQNQMNVLFSQVRQEFVEGLAKLASEQQREWAALEELLLNMLNQPIEQHSPELDDSRGAATGR